MKGLISSERFVPHTQEHMVQSRAFWPPLPEKFYDGLVSEYAAMTDVAASRIVYASEGLHVTGIMATPAEISEAGHPILIYNRGGNKEFGKLTVLSVMRSMAPFARNGYLVFASNYRGNDGGQGEDEFGGADVNDVLALIDVARSHPGFDGKNLFMVGHSRGGMMTYLALKHGAKVGAAVSIAGISDLDAPVEKGRFKALVHAADVQAALDERSARRWPRELSAPLLLLHGDADDKVDVSHSLLLADDLKALRSPYELEVYPGGNHALVRHWDAVIKRILGWLGRHRV